MEKANEWISVEEHKPIGVTESNNVSKDDQVNLNICDIARVHKQPKSDEASEVVQLLNTFGQFCTLNGIKLTDSNKVGQAVIDFLKSDIYEIFKNR